MRTQNYRISLIVGIVAILSVGSLYLTNLGSFNQDAIVVYTTKAENVQKQSGTNFSGKLEAVESANIVSKITGKIGTVKVDIGNTVNAGDILAIVEANELAASVAQAQASLEIARSDLETARIDYDIQKQNFERNKALVEKGALSQSDFDNKFVLPFAKAKEKVLRGAEAQVRQAEANLQLAQANYGNCIITSPIKGIVTVKNINVGELASSEIALFSVVNLDRVFVMTSIGEEKINEINVGDHVSVRIGAVSDLPFNGTVANIAQAAGSVTKTYLVKVQIDNEKHVLKPGMFAELLWESQNPSEVVIPKTALLNEVGKNYVWTVKSGIVSKKEILAGVADTVNIRIKKGLIKGEEVVIYGQELLKEGMRVAVHH